MWLFLKHEWEGLNAFGVCVLHISVVCMLLDVFGPVWVLREGLRLFSPAAISSFRMNIAGELQLKPVLVIPRVCVGK